MDTTACYQRDSRNTNHSSGGAYIYQGDQKGEEAEDVESQDEELEFGQDGTGVQVDYNGHDHDSPVEQRALPLGRYIPRVVQRDQCQDEIRAQISTGGYDRLPATYNKPA